jgi:hypothetical protein
MKISTQLALTAVKAIKEIQDIKMSSKTAWALNRLSSKLVPQNKSFEEVRNDLIIKKYGVIDPENATQYKVPAEEMDNYLKEITEILNTEEEIDIKKLNISDFDGMDLPVTFFASMSDFIEE